MMTPKSTYCIEPGMHVVVVGLGKSGLSAVKFLSRLGARVSVSEGGRADQLEGAMLHWLKGKGVFLETAGHSSELFLQADRILVSPGVPLTVPALEAARRKGIPILGELALAAGYCRTPIVAVTGTNGKSTVTSLLGDMFKACGKQVFVGGNIGIPLTDYLLGPQEAEVAVLEVSSFQLDTAGGFRPRAAILLNISPDHLDRYPSYQAYGDAKFRIFAAQQPEDVAILNADDPEIAGRLGRMKRQADFRSRLFLIGEKQKGPAGAFLDGKQVLLRGIGGSADKEAYDLGLTKLSEPPNLENAMAAILAARLMACPPGAVRQGLADFAPLPHRLALVAELGGIRFYDDSKATNIGSVLAALQGMDRPVILIAGGRDKGGDYRLLAGAVQARVAGMVLIGEAREKIAAALGDLVPCQLAGDMEEAVRCAYRLAAPGQAVLLSPACASFDMFSGYAERGELFRSWVRKLQAETQGAGGQLRRTA